MDEVEKAVQFVIDNIGEQPSEEHNPKHQTIGKVFDDFLKAKGPQIFATTEDSTSNASTSRQLSKFEKFSKDMKFADNLGPNYQMGHHSKKKKNTASATHDYQKPTVDKVQLENVLAKSIVLKPNFEELKSVPSQRESEKRLKKQRQLERDKSKGTKWFNMPATEVTDELKNDLKVLQMRSVLDPKHFYKKNDLAVLPKYFQVGKVMDSPLDFYNDRLTKKERKRTLVDELLADAEFQRYNKKKYTEVLIEKQKTHYKAYRQAKRLKKAKK